MAADLSYRELTVGQALVPEEVEALQDVLEASPRYWQLIENRPAPEDTAQGVLSALPNGKSYHDKLVLLVADAEGDFACVDLVFGYPDATCTMLGLLLLRESHQGQGLGVRIFREIERRAIERDQARVRIGVVATNDRVLPFWKRLGFSPTGQKRSYAENGVVSEIIVLEKPLEDSLAVSGI
jgi:GNAT superfamily N-acetyltransferase